MTNVKAFLGRDNREREEIKKKQEEEEDGQGKTNENLSDEK